MDTVLCIHLFLLLMPFLILDAAQNNASAGWEAKLVEFFKDKLRQTDAQTSVMESSEPRED